MDLSTVITAETIDLQIDAATKKEAVTHLVEMLYQAGRIDDSEPLLESIFERERIESTDMGIGVAIPHGVSDSVKEASVAIGKLRTPFFWNGTQEDKNKPIFAIFLLTNSPGGRGDSHIEILSQIASLLIDDDFVAFLKQTTDADTLLKTINTYIGEM